MKRKNIISWLAHCPSSDINFKSNLEEANLDELQAALKILKTKPESKTAIKLIERKINKHATKKTKKAN